MILIKVISFSSFKNSSPLYYAREALEWNDRNSHCWPWLISVRSVFFYGMFDIST